MQFSGHPTGFALNFHHLRLSLHLFINVFQRNFVTKCRKIQIFKISINVVAIVFDNPSCSTRSAIPSNVDYAIKSGK